jgi:hypothetical protein
MRLIVRATAAPFGPDFQTLTRHWLGAAYADRPPPSPDFEALIVTWRAHWEREG